MANGNARRRLDSWDEAVGEDEYEDEQIGGGIPEAMDALFAASQAESKAKGQKRGRTIGKHALTALAALILPAILPGGAAYGAAGGLAGGLRSIRGGPPPGVRSSGIFPPPRSAMGRLDPARTPTHAARARETGRGPVDEDFFFQSEGAMPGWKHGVARQPRAPDMGPAQNLGHAAEQGAAVARWGGGPGRNFSLGAPRPAGLGPEGRAMAPLSAQPPQPADMLRSLLGGRSGQLPANVQAAQQRMHAAEAAYNASRLPPGARGMPGPTGFTLGPQRPPTGAGMAASKRGGITASQHPGRPTPQNPGGSQEYWNQPVTPAQPSRLRPNRLMTLGEQSILAEMMKGRGG